MDPILDQNQVIPQGTEVVVVDFPERYGVCWDERRWEPIYGHLAEELKYNCYTSVIPREGQLATFAQRMGPDCIAHVPQRGDIWKNIHDDSSLCLAVIGVGGIALIDIRDAQVIGAEPVYLWREGYRLYRRKGCGKT